MTAPSAAQTIKKLLAERQRRLTFMVGDKYLIDLEGDPLAAAAPAIAAAYLKLHEAVTRRVEDAEGEEGHDLSCPAVRIADDGDGRWDIWVSAPEKCSCGMTDVRAALDSPLAESKEGEGV